MEEIQIGCASIFVLQLLLASNNHGVAGLGTLAQDQTCRWLVVLHKAISTVLKKEEFVAVMVMKVILKVMPALLEAVVD